MKISREFLCSPELLGMNRESSRATMYHFASEEQSKSYFREYSPCTTSLDGKWQFVKNTSAADNERVHFIPVWFVDGDYTVSVTASRVWTPAGVISATRTSNSFAVDGSIYDDYFVGN